VRRYGIVSKGQPLCKSFICGIKEAGELEAIPPADEIIGRVYWTTGRNWPEERKGEKEKKGDKKPSCR